MTRPLPNISALCILAAVLAFAVPHVHGQSQTGVVNPLLTLGSIRPDAIPFRVWTTPWQDAPFKPGDRVAVHFKAERSCYLVVANVAPTGDVQILFPYRDKEIISNRMEAEEEYTLFGEGAGLRIAIHKKTPSTSLVFYVSARPVDFVVIEGDETVMKVPADNKEAQDALRAHVEKMAAQKGFNRRVLTIETERGQRESPRAVTGAKGWKEESEAPEAVTGAAGWKDTSETPEAVTGTAGRSGTSGVK